MINQSLVNDFEKQVLNCKHLLSIFQSEREMYYTSDLINVKNVMTLLREKKTLIDNFCSWEETLMNNTIDIFNAENMKSWIRELRTIFEQLLIIDTENEFLLKKRLNNNSSSKRVTAPTSTLKINKPFVFNKKKTEDVVRQPEEIQGKNYRNIKEYLKLNTANIKACAR